MSYLYDDLKHLAYPDCKMCGGSGRYTDYSEDEWGMVMYIKCDCVKKNEAEMEAAKERRKENVPLAKVDTTG